MTHDSSINSELSCITHHASNNEGITFVVTTRLLRSIFITLVVIQSPMDNHNSNDVSGIVLSDSNPTESSVPPADNLSDNNELEHRETQDERRRPPRNRRNRQRKRPRSEWLMNEEYSSAKINDEPNDTGIAITRLDDVIQQAREEYRHDDTHKNAVISTAAQGVLKPRESAPFLRVVYPYPHTFTSFCKARWIGRSILDVYCTEFGSYPLSYYQVAIQQGRIRVSDNIVSVDYKLQAKDILLHTVHRHEPGVVVHSNTVPYIKIVEQTSDLIAIDKPSTMPVHPCGGYYRNSLMNLLHETYKNQKFYTIHRLDRLTSGLVVIAKNAKVAQEWGQAIQLRDQHCQKIYLARVKGRFGHYIFGPINNACSLPLLQHDENTTPSVMPLFGEYNNINEDDTLSEAQIRRRKYAYGYWMTDAITGGIVNRQCKDQYVPDDRNIDEWLENVINRQTTATTCNVPIEDGESRPFLWFNVACPVRIEQPKIGICAAGRFDDVDDTTYVQTVKPAQTRFGVVRYDSVTDSTIVIVQPMTGRTHQIRIHLQHIQHSIANDPNYGGQLWYGNPDGQRACADAQHCLDQSNVSIAAIGLTENDTVSTADGTFGVTHGLVTTDEPATDKEIQDSLHCANSHRKEGELLADWIARTCVWCNRLDGSTNDHYALSNKDLRNAFERRAKLEFLVRSPGLWLHAFQYKVNNKSFRTEIPYWCHI